VLIVIIFGNPPCRKAAPHRRPLTMLGRLCLAVVRVQRWLRSCRRRLERLRSWESRGLIGRSVR